MDLNLFQQALLHTFSPDPTQRHAAEQHLAEYKAQPGFYPALVHVATHQFPREIRQAAAIALKNSVKSSWQLAERARAEQKPVPPEAFTDESKAVIRQEALTGLLHEGEAPVRVLLAEIVNCIIIHDYPDQWPGLLEAIMGAVVSNDVLLMQNGLLALRKLVKKYEYKPKKERQPLEAIVQRVFPTLHQLMHALVVPNGGNNSIEAANMIRLTLKTFWSCTQFALPSHIDNEHLMSWLQLMCVLLHKPLPEAHEGLEPAGQPVEVEERKRWPWWKVKKWACVIVTRYSQRYGMPRYVPEQHRAFAKQFYEKMAPQLLEPMVNIMCLRSRGQYCTDRVVQLSLEFVNSSLENAPTFLWLKPHLEHLLFNVVFPMLQPRDEDVRLFDEDPIEYIRKGGSCDVDSEFYDPKDSALGLMKDAVTKRGKQLLPKLLAFLEAILNHYHQAPHEQRDVKAKDAALLVLGSLHRELKKPSKPYAAVLEAMLVTHVLPEFKSPVGIMRSRACWMMRHFHDIEFKQPDVLRHALECVLTCLCDPCLPVRVEAATSIRELALLKGSEVVLVPHLTAVLQQYLLIMNEVGSDEVVQALDMLIDRFDKHMVPHAKAMAAQLSRTFFNYASEGEQDDDKALAASQCLDALNTLLQSVRDHKDILRACEDDVVPVLALVLGPDGDYYEYLESALDLLTCLTFYAHDISPQLWQLFPLIQQVFDRWAYDYIQNMVSPIDNYVHKDTHTFLHGTAPNGVRYVELVLSMAGKVLGDDRGDYREACRALLLLKSVLNASKGQLDAWLPAMVHMCVQRLSLQTAAQQQAAATSNKKVRRPPRRLTARLLETVSLCLYSNALVTLQVLEAHGWTEAVFQSWFSHFDTFTSRTAQRQVVLGLTAVLELPGSAMPPLLASNLGLILARMTPLLEERAADDSPIHHRGAGHDDDEDYADFLRKHGRLGDDYDEEDEEEEEDDEDDDEDDDEEEDQEVEDDEDYVSKKDEQYMRALYRMQREKDDDDDEAGGDDDDEEDDDEEEEEDYITCGVLDEVDEIAYFHHALAQGFNREPAVFQSAHQSLAPDVKARLEAVYNQGQARALGKENQAPPPPPAPPCMPPGGVPNVQPPAPPAMPLGGGRQQHR